MSSFQLALTVSGTCDTRESKLHIRSVPCNGYSALSPLVAIAVLKRDGTNVVTDSACKATSGNWVSPYDNVATTLASDLDIVSSTIWIKYGPITIADSDGPGRTILFRSKR